jgi:hypothetical protein
MTTQDTLMVVDATEKVLVDMASIRPLMPSWIRRGTCVSMVEV